MHRFEYAFLREGVIPASLLRYVEAIAACNAMLKSQHIPAGRCDELVELATVQSVKGSNALEGIVTTDKRLVEIVTENSDPETTMEAEIAGYRDALRTVSAQYASLDIRSHDIKALHSQMLSFTTAEWRGRYKMQDNIIIGTHEDGTKYVVFRPVTAPNTALAMEQLELAYLAARDDANISQLILIPCVILDFLCIHPFRDGNGRISRLLTLLLLYKNGYDIGRYVSLEHMIHTHKQSYYAALAHSSKGWHENANTYVPFIEHFLSILWCCFAEMDKQAAR